MPRRRSHSFFTRAEFQQLLALYSRRVGDGIWRDYAIAQREQAAVFSVFRNARERPDFAVVKNTATGTFDLYHGAKRVKRGTSLADALADLDRRSGFRVLG